MNADGEQVDRPYRAAIIGCGRVAGGMDDDPLRTAIWTHAGAYSAHRRTELVAAADRDPQTLAAFGRRWGVANLYRDATDLLGHEAVDILSICTWSDSHAEYALLGAEAGVKAIWCEKPVARTLAEADQMLEACRDVVLAVNHGRRWHPCYRRGKELLQEGAIGRVQGAICAYSGGIANIGTHLFDTLNYLLGTPQIVWARLGSDDDLPDPSPSGDIAYECGALAHVVGCDPRAYLVFEIDILGTEGRLRIMDNGHRAELWGVGDSPHYSQVRELEFRQLVYEGDEGQFMVKALSDIISSIECGGQPACNGSSGRASLELTAAFLKSYRTGRKVALPLTGKDVYRKVPVR